MHKIKEAIVVEGAYDKIKLSSFLDAAIFITGGFQIIGNKEMIETIKTVAERTGVVILTDSDSAGFMIRNYLKQQLPPECVKHAYIPDVAGKERRKRTAGKEGLLGVEGIDRDTILKSLRDAGCTIDGQLGGESVSRPITKADLYALGLCGGEGSAERRKSLAHELNLPAHLSANMLLTVLNRLLDYDELVRLAEEIG